MIAHVDTSNHTPTVVHEAKSETPARGKAPAPRYPARPLPVEPEDEPTPRFLNRHGRRAEAAMARKHATKLRLAARARLAKKSMSAKRAAKKEQTCST